MISTQNNVFEQTEIYDNGSGSGACAITKANAGKTCEVSLVLLLAVLL